MTPRPNPGRFALRRGELSKDIFVSQPVLLESEMEQTLFSPSSKKRVFRAT
jgi:hypothetical protein